MTTVTPPTRFGVWSGMAAFGPILLRSLQETMPMPCRKETKLGSWDGPPVTLPSTITLSEVPWSNDTTRWQVDHSVKVGPGLASVYWRVFKTLEEAHAHAEELAEPRP